MPTAPATTYIIQGMGGMMSITGLPDGEPGGGPMRAGVAIADLFTGHVYRQRDPRRAGPARAVTGEGAHIDMALFDTQLAMLANQASNALVSGEDPPRQGNTHPNIVPYQPFDGGRPADHHRGRQRPPVRAAGRDPRARRNGRATRSLRPMRRGSPIARRWSNDRGRSSRPSPPRDWLAAARGGRHPGRADQPHQPGARRSAGGASRHACRRSAAAGWARCRRSARRSASTASAPMRRSRRPRLASIAMRC